MKITWFGHSCFLIETGAARILIDPFLTGNPVFEGLGKSVAEATAGTTHIALTHGHDDHVGDTVSIAGATGATLATNFELANFLAARGVANVEFMNPGGTVDCGDFRLTLTPAIHSASTVVDGSPVYLGPACGLVITPSSGPTVYHMGDTDVMSEFEIIQDLHAPEIGIVPVGDRFTMGAKSAAYACKRFFKFSTVVPCHYGTFPIIDATADAFVAEMAGHNVRVAEPGVPFDV